MLVAGPAYPQINAVLVKVELKENNSWQTVSPTDTKILVPLGINCACSQEPAQLALKATFALQGDSKALILVGDTPAPQGSACPAEVPIVGSLDNLIFKGTLSAELRPQGSSGQTQAVFAGYLYEAGKNQNSAAMRISIAGLPGNPTSACPQSGPVTAIDGTSDNSQQGGSNGTAAAQGAGLSARFNLAVANTIAASRAGLAGVLAQWRDGKDSAGRVVPATNFSSGVDYTKGSSPPCREAVRLSSYSLGPQCDGREMVSLLNDVLPLSFSYSPSDQARSALFGVPGMKHDFSYTLHTANNPSAPSMFTKLVTPDASIIPLRRVSGALHQPAEQGDQSLKVYFAGVRTLTARAEFNGKNFLFRRSLPTDNVFWLESISDTQGVLFRLFGTNESPKWFQMRSPDTGDSVTYKVVKSGDNMQLLEWERRTSATTTTRPNTVAATFKIEGGLLTQITTRDSLTTLRWALLDNGTPVITGVYKGSGDQTIATASEYLYAAFGNILAKGFYPGLGSTIQSFYSYQDNSISVASNPELKGKTTYTYSQVGLQFLVTSQATSDSTQNFEYHQNLPGLIKTITDNRFTLPVFELLSFSANSLSWRDLTAKYTRTETSPSQQESSVSLSVEPSNPLARAYTVERRSSLNSASTKVTMGALVFDKRESFENGQTKTNSTITVAGVKLAEIENVSSLKESNGVLDSADSYTDYITGVKFEETTSFSDKSTVSELIATFASGIKYSQSFKSEVGADNSFSFVSTERFLSRLVSSLSFSSSGDRTTSKEKSPVAGAFNYLVENSEGRFDANSELLSSRYTYSWEAP